MMPAKSCYTCYYGGTRRGPDCEIASTAVCCEDWIAPKTIRIQAVIEVEFDLRGACQDYQMEFQDFKGFCDFIGKTEEQYILGLLQSDGIEITSITDIEQLPDDGEAYPKQSVRQREVIIA
jgi:hypothetical protein